jgi:hypothetical protein
VTGGTVAPPTATATVHRTRPTGSKASTVSTTNGHSGVVTPADQGAKLPSGIAHVWPENALSPVPAAPQ